MTSPNKPLQSLACIWCKSNNKAPFDILKERHIRFFLPGFHHVPCYRSIFDKCDIAEFINIGEALACAQVAAENMKSLRAIHSYQEKEFYLFHILLPMLEILQ
jgi:hypothetical protein